jgi:hypothetical protein
MRRPGIILTALAAALAGACGGGPATPAASPRPDLSAVRAVAVYRTMAESLYVRSTRRPVAIAPQTLDTACAEIRCPALPARWGVDSIWWVAGDPEAERDARAARADLLARAGARLPLAPVAAGQANLVPLDTNAIPLGPDTGDWVAFRDAHNGAAGFVRFSPVGFAPSGRSAVVFVSWRCGPTCGHELAASLTATSDTTWQVSDVLLLQPGRR